MQSFSLKFSADPLRAPEGLHTPDMKYIYD